MKRKGKLKKILIPLIAVVLVLAIGIGVFALVKNRGREPVNVYAFQYFGMTEYWGDNQESYGPVSTDRIQTVYLSDTQTVTQVLVKQGDTVKKGDVLMTYDTTLSDLALEKERLGVEKLKLQLSDAEKRLGEINSMVPMVIPTPSPDPEEPENPDLGELLTNPYKVTSPNSFDGSNEALSLICWLHGDTGIDATLFAALREQAQILQAKTQAKPEDSKPTEPPLPETAPPDASTAPTGTPSEPSAPTEPSEPSEPIEPSEPTKPSEPTEPTEPSEPVKPEVNDFYVIFKITDANRSKGATLLWQGIHLTFHADIGSFTFRFFDASGVSDPSQTGADKPNEPDIDFGSGFTASQIAEMRAEQQKTIRDLEFQIKMAEANYKIKQTEAADGNVVAQFDGEVVSLLSEEEAKQTEQPFLKVSGGGGFYVTGSLSELMRDQVQIGQEVTIQDWNTGTTLTGTVQSIGDYPTSDDGYSGNGNPNVSYYPFTVFIDGSADMMEGYYVSIQYSAATAENGIYLENPFVRTEGGRSYVYVRGEDGTLVKRNVTVGKSLWGSYTEILSGLTADDYVAFPYGKNIVEGAKCVESDPSEFYR